MNCVVHLGSGQCLLQGCKCPHLHNIYARMQMSITFVQRWQASRNEKLPAGCVQSRCGAGRARCGRSQSHAPGTPHSKLGILFHWTCQQTTAARCWKVV